jgi:4-amino-4-deoxy-L-arabinose transferase-like glycosyltransferase
MSWRSIPTSNVARRVAVWTAWALVIYVVMFWRLGFPSFWDPDEAVYAVVTRRMLRTGDWLAPIYNGQPFFDKPILFYWLQLLAFRVFGATEFAARLVPAVSAIGVIAVTGWAGRVFFNRQVGYLAALMVAVLPATFALSAYAILDMTFTLFLFAGVVLAASAVMHDRPRRQWWAYLCIALAVLTKGPLAIVLAGVSFLLALAIAPGARRALLSLRWGWGLAFVIAVSSPWFVYMWWRFGYAFIEGYLLRENIWLYAAQLYTTTRAPGFYLRVAAVGFLPFTPILIGRAVDALRGDRVDDAERLFWAWSLAITAFFTCSRFKLDHYIYPVLPALSVIAAHTWWRLQHAASLRPHLGAAAAVAAIAFVLAGAGLYVYIKLETLPIELSRAMLIVPIALVAAGVGFCGTLVRNQWRPRAVPLLPTAALLVVYAVVLGVGLDALERGKPMKDLAGWISENAPADAVITAYRLERWKTSFRFYADRRMQTVESVDELVDSLRQPGTHYTVMRQDELDAVRKAAPEEPLRIVRERRGLTNTSGRGLRRKTEDWPNYVIVTDATEPESAPAPGPPVDPPVRPRSSRSTTGARR